jgi:hypothetical protein
LFIIDHTIGQNEQYVVLLIVLTLFEALSFTKVNNLLNDLVESCRSQQLALLDRIFVNIDDTLDAGYFWIVDISIHGETVGSPISFWFDYGTEAIEWEFLV